MADFGAEPQPYLPVWKAMREFTDTRDGGTSDEIWFLEHSPVYTLGQAGKEEHLLAPGAIPIFKTDRGGQVTYHGPGQLVCYPLLNVRRLKLGVRDLVVALGNSVIDLLGHYGIASRYSAEAPGVYVEDAKIAALGLRIRRGFSFHGISLNIAMDLEPFGRINPCGYPGLGVVQMSDFLSSDAMPTLNDIKQKWTFFLARGIGLSEDSVEITCKSRL